jgi:hypothetical protein
MNSIKQYREALKKLYAVCWLLQTRGSWRIGAMDRASSIYAQIALNNAKIILSDASLVMNEPETLADHLRRLANG